MKKQLTGLLCMILTLGIALTGCGTSIQTPSDDSEETASTGSMVEQNTESFSGNEENNIPGSGTTELIVRFGDDGEPFTMVLENNSTAQAIAGYVGTTDWRLPIYSYDESDVMQYYDIPSRYEIPDNSETVTEAHAGDVFYSNPNRIVLYYHDAEISEEYTKIGTFEATDDFIAAVENNPVLEGWGNKIVLISDGE